MSAISTTQQPVNISAPQFHRLTDGTGGSKQVIYSNHPAANTSPSFPGNDPVANLTLPKKSFFELEAIAKKQSHPALGSIDLQKKAICDLWPIIKRHGRRDRKQWTYQTPTWEVLTWLFSEIDAMVGKAEQEAEWALKKTESDEFEIHTLHEYQLQYDAYWLETEPLLYLFHENKPAHDLIVHLLSLIHHKCEVPSIASDCDLVEQTVEMYFQDLDYDNDEDKRVIENLGIDQLYYTKCGDPVRYHNKIENDKISVEEFQALVETFSPSNDIETQVLHWCKTGLDLIKSGNQLSTFFDVNAQSEYMDDPYPWDYFQIVWSVGTDWVAEERDRSFDANYSCNGRVAPMAFEYVLSKNSDNTLPPTIPSWPYDLGEFFVTGCNIMDEISKKYKGENQCSMTRIPSHLL